MLSFVRSSYSSNLSIVGNPYDVIPYSTYRELFSSKLHTILRYKFKNLDYLFGSRAEWIPASCGLVAIIVGVVLLVIAGKSDYKLLCTVSTVYEKGKGASCCTQVIVYSFSFCRSETKQLFQYDAPVGELPVSRGWLH